MRRIYTSSAFTLIELSIVLVILGLLAGGIVTGQSMIEAAELRAVASETSQMTSAVNSFREKYFSYPGDMSNATQFWGKLAAHCNTEAGTASLNGTCNGNGNDVIQQNAAAAGQEAEGFMFWQHLALAGMITGEFSGLAGPDGDVDADPETNVFISQFKNACYNVDSNIATSTERFDLNYGINAVELGTADAGNSDCDRKFFTPMQAYRIDDKVDDGMPGQGTVIAKHWDMECAAANNNMHFDAPYNFDSEADECSLAFIRMF